MATDASAAPGFAAIFLEMAESPAIEGQLQRRLPTAGGCALYIGVRKPSNVRLMRAEFPAGALTSQVSLPSFKSLSLELDTGDARGSANTTVILQAPLERDNDIFTRLIEDVANVTAPEADAGAAVQSFRTRLLQWQRLLQRERQEGLGDEEQRGLYGELCVLEEQVLSVLPPLEAVQAWTGPKRTAKDFHFVGGVALEVKSSLSRPPYDIKISSERQLDAEGLVSLHLVHRLFEAQRGAGEPLPVRVERLRHMLVQDVDALSLFDDRLEEAGYFDLHAARYLGIGYTPRGTHLYQVRDGFPRLIPGTLPLGVGGVEYVISASACTQFAEPMDVLVRTLEGLT